MITAIALDDEPLALAVVQQFCKRNERIELLHAFSKIGEAKKFLAQNTVDVLFLDVNMPAQTGIDFFKSLTDPPLLIFTTAYSEFALEGFELSAVDYLLKPFTYDRFNVAVEKACRMAALKNKPAQEANDEFITIRADYSLLKVVLADILFIESLDNYVKIRMSNGKHVLARMPLKTIADMLPQDFLRIHRSYIVPLKSMTAVRNKSVFLSGGQELPIGNSYEKELMTKFSAKRA